jgi:xanthine dehydrogenase YagT iron-sulfur-binding subunit
VHVRLDVNGQSHALELEPRTTLLDALRANLGLTGTKKGCDRGQCGACTVLADGERVLSCLSLAVAQEGVRIVTVEGLGEPAHLHPVQAAFVAEDAFQCGYCTPGQVCSGVAMLAEMRRGDASAATTDVRRAEPAGFEDAEIRERMSGNLCRCGAYPNIVRALKAVGSPR